MGQEVEECNNKKVRFPLINEPHACEVRGTLVYDVLTESVP